MIETIFDFLTTIILVIYFSMLLLSALHRFYPNVINNLYAILELEILLGSKNNTETVIDNLGYKDLMIIDWR